MSIDMQKLILKEIFNELNNIDRIINNDYSKVDKNTEIKLSKIHHILTKDE